MGCIDVYEVGEHSKSWDQSDDLHESPKGKEDSEKHFDGCAKVFSWESVDGVIRSEMRLGDSELGSEMRANNAANSESRV